MRTGIQQNHVKRDENWVEAMIIGCLESYWTEMSTVHADMKDLERCIASPQYTGLHNAAHCHERLLHF
jgi:hypothetical protein